MNRARLRRRCIAVARYANHYSHIPMVLIGGWGVFRAMSEEHTRGGYYRVRRQRKHRFMDGYRR